MTYEQAEIKIGELRQKDLSAGTDNKRILMLPALYDRENYACLIRWTK